MREKKNKLDSARVATTALDAIYYTHRHLANRKF